MKLEAIILMQYLLVSLDGLTTGIMIELILGSSEKSLPGRIGRIGCFWLLELVLMLPKLIQGNATTTSLGQLLQLAGHVLLIMRLYRVSWLNGLKWFLAYLLASCAGELLYLSAHPDVFMRMANWTRENVLISLAETEVLVFCIKMLFVALVRNQRWNRLKNPYFIFYAVYSLSVILLYPILIRAGQSVQTGHIRSIMPCFLFASTAVFFLMTLSWIRVKKDLCQCTAFEESGTDCSAGQFSDESLEKFRHDQQNMTQTVVSLIENGSEDEAIALLKQMKDGLSENGSHLN